MYNNAARKVNFLPAILESEVSISLERTQILAGAGCFCTHMPGRAVDARRRHHGYRDGYKVYSTFMLCCVALEAS